MTTWQERMAKGCNLHADCNVAEEQAAQQGRPERFGRGSVRLTHCHDETCPDCYGS